VLWERLEALGVPVVAGAPFGHGKRQRPWVSGGRVVVDAARGTVTLDPLAARFTLPPSTAAT
jgi:muramoyltetrapeptide carboxypeptidase LdcA involved in peptidoglycan recycling